MLLSTGKDSRTYVWDLQTEQPSVFCEVSHSTSNFECAWAPWNTGLVSTCSLTDGVNIHSTLTSQSDSAYVPKSYVGGPGGRCGASWGFGGKITQ